MLSILPVHKKEIKFTFAFSKDSKIKKRTVKGFFNADFDFFERKNNKIPISRTAVLNYRYI